MECEDRHISTDRRQLSIVKEHHKADACLRCRGGVRRAWMVCPCYCPHENPPLETGNRRSIGMTQCLLELENSGHDGGRSYLLLLARAYLDVTSQRKPRSPQCKSMASVMHQRMRMPVSCTCDWSACLVVSIPPW